MCCAARSPCQETPEPAGAGVHAGGVQGTAPLPAPRTPGATNGASGSRGPAGSPPPDAPGPSPAAPAGAEAPYRHIVDNAGEGIVVVQDGVIVLSNRALSSLVGLPPEEVTGRVLADFLHPDDVPLVLDRHRRRLGGEAPPAHYGCRVVHRDGRVIWVEVSGAVIEWRGRPASLGFITDVTVRRELEQQLQRTLAERETILGNSLAGIFFLDSASRIQWANRAAQQMFALAPDTLPGALIDDLFLDRQARDEVVGQAARAIREGRPYQKELQLRTAGGAAVWMLLSGKAVQPGDPSQGSVWAVMDITERRRAQQDLQRALAQQRELNELKSRFVAMTSHEFRTPLAAILNAVELLRDHGPRLPAAEQEELLAIAHAAARRMAAMLDDVLTVAQVEAPRLECSPALLDLRTVCEAIVDEASRVAREQGAGPAPMRLSVQGRPHARLDERLLRHILCNLVSNAIKYSPGGTPVIVEVTGRPGETELRVADHGIGIPAAHLPRLFETFSRADNVGRIPGTGLGMAIVNNAVERHGGSIDVHSEPGEGTCFVVRLPEG